MDNMSGARLRTQQRSCQSGREVVRPLPFPKHPLPFPPVTLTPGTSLPLPKALNLLISPCGPLQTNLWSSGLGMKLEAVTPFLGKYRPFVGRCCQTCTPKSWVSDIGLGPMLGSLWVAWLWEPWLREAASLMSFQAQLSLPMPLLLSLGNGGTGPHCAVGLGLAYSPGGSGWGSAEGSARRWGMARGLGSDQACTVPFSLGDPFTQSLSIGLKTSYVATPCAGTDGIQVLVEICCMSSAVDERTT